eukprot:COSAG05_NODE_224_length_13609_cov_26.220429_1_plen_64_part_10
MQVSDFAVGGGWWVQDHGSWLAGWLAGWMHRRARMRACIHPASRARACIIGQILDALRSDHALL